MKKLLLLLTLAALPLHQLVAQETRLTIYAENETIKSVLLKIEKKSNYTFVYSSSAIDVEQKISVNYLNETIETIVSDLCNRIKLSYIFEKNKIILKPYEGNVSQDNHVWGIIVDESGEPVVGATIKNDVSGSYVASDLDGSITSSNRI
jgi:TonB-dependent starch-binding outer membrane protein SusC